MTTSAEMPLDAFDTSCVSVLGFGDNTADVYDHTNTMYPGGNAVNFAVACKRLGVGRSAYMGIFGNDRPGEHIITSLQEDNIELVKCRQVIGPNGACHVALVDGDRVFVSSNEGGIRGESRYVLDRFDLEYVKQFDVVHTGNYCFTERQLPKLASTGVPVSFDFSDDSSDAYIEELAPYVDFAFMSCGALSKQDAEARMRWVAEQGPQVVVATMGSEGSLAFDGERIWHQGIKPVEHLVDTMAAGDTFLSGFVVSWITSTKSGVTGCERMESALDFAASAAAQACSWSGSWGHGVPFSVNA